MAASARDRAEMRAGTASARDRAEARGAKSRRRRKSRAKRIGRGAKRR